MLVGGIGLLDLRLVGLFRSLPVAPLSRALTPVAIAGLILMVPSGLTMVAADAAVAESATFRWKLLLIALALTNALAFRFSGATGSTIGIQTRRSPVARWRRDRSCCGSSSRRWAG